MAENVYQIVTNRIIEQLEQGIIPWQRPWTGIRNGAISHVSGKPYSFLNQLLLGKPGEWLTFNQAKAEGGSIRKGEKSRIVVFYKQLAIEEKANGKPVLNADGKPVMKMVPVLKYFRVFHVDQCEGVQPKHKTEELPPVDPIEAAENTIRGYVDRSGVKLFAEHCNNAYYSPASDEVHVPSLDQYEEAAEYYSTTFHELVHSTGHPGRLNRLDKKAAFGSEEYSKEELIAEMGSAILMNEEGIETSGTFRNSAGYIQGWLTKLKSDNRFVVQAAGKAEKAVKMILNIDQNRKEAEA